ncbi:putative pectate lyase 14 isoform X2 [Papaver somniferum]|uniref:putative pectate lyase 14 isoform X2 n=1 Tax=Papaver somniferum TaxID=3469 RepID=UPI000E6F6605|nr:putative pectate lyase 14 isoform X2 [Papaver somniferum]
MAVSLRCLSLCLVTLLLFVILIMADQVEKKENSDLRIQQQTKQLQSSTINTTTMADLRPEEEWTHEHAVADPDEVASQVATTIRNSTERRNLGGYFSCGSGNPIDDCWRCDKDWHKNRKRLADCGIGFGRKALGGRDGDYYVVTDPSDHDAVNPKPGTLRHAVIQDKPLWIVFKRDMVITLKQELIMNSFKTIDGRGVNVHIANGACITIQYITNVIIHGIHIHDCKPTAISGLITTHSPTVLMVLLMLSWLPLPSLSLTITSLTTMR